MLKIVLASSSPRRRELLAQIGLAFEVRTADMEEKASAVWPGGVVEELSRQKAEAVLGMLADAPEDLLVIGADTVVAEGYWASPPAWRRRQRCCAGFQAELMRCIPELLCCTKEVGMRGQRMPERQERGYAGKYFMR